MTIAIKPHEADKIRKKRRTASVVSFMVAIVFAIISTFSTIIVPLILSVVFFAVGVAAFIASKESDKNMMLGGGGGAEMAPDGTGIKFGDIQLSTMLYHDKR